MRSIDIHAHIVPAALSQLKEDGNWHGYAVEKAGPGQDFLVRGTKRGWLQPKLLWGPDERLADMDSMGVDVHVLSIWVGLYGYDLEADVCVATSRDFNNFVAELPRSWPSRFAGLATLPMQDTKAAVAELERAVLQLGLKGAMINDHVNGRTLDHPDFLPFWKAAEEMGALILFHQASETLVSPRTSGYHLSNSVGNLVDRTVTFATLVFSGLMDRFPDLKICLAHGGGYTCFGLGRMDRAWEVREEAKANIPNLPSTYARRFYYDCLTHSEETLRFIIDRVGPERVLLGSDWPFDMGVDSPVEWINSLESLTQDEKELILWKNPERLLGV